LNQESLIQSPTNRPTDDLEESYWWYRARKQIISDSVQRFVSPGSDILDFGAGSGVIAKQLVDLGYKVIAADVSTSALAGCRKRGLNTLDLKTGWPAPASADCVLAGDVLEHLGDDVGGLQRLRMALRPHGLLVAAVPAYDFLWSGEDYVSNHFRRYTKSSLEKVVLDSGYTIEWCSYFNALLLPVVIAVVFYKRLLRPRDMYISDVQPLPNWQNEILYKIFATERKILPHFRFQAGASILLVARASA
jgi:SAM-dependent methyltransferase